MQAACRVLGWERESVWQTGVTSQLSGSEKFYMLEIESAFHLTSAPHFPIYVFIFMYLLKISSVAPMRPWGRRERNVFTQSSVFHRWSFKVVTYHVQFINGLCFKELWFLQWGCVIHKSLWNAFWEFMPVISISEWSLLFERLKLTIFTNEFPSLKITTQKDHQLMIEKGWLFADLLFIVS